MTVSAFGMQLHAASTVDGRDRKRLERVCRYLLRPPFARDAIEALPDGRVRVHFSRSTRTGASFTTITRDTFLARLAALFPPPRFNMVRYYGVVAGRHHLRLLVAPNLEPLERKPRQLPLFFVHRDAELPAITTSAPADRPPSRVAWASLLARVFSTDVTVCPRCDGPMRIVRTVTDPDEIAAALGPAVPRAHGPILPTSSSCFADRGARIQSSPSTATAPPCLHVGSALPTPSVSRRSTAIAAIPTTGIGPIPHRHDHRPAGRPCSRPPTPQAPTSPLTAYLSTPDDSPVPARPSRRRRCCTALLPERSAALGSRATRRAYGGGP